LKINCSGHGTNVRENNQTNDNLHKSTNSFQNKLFTIVLETMQRIAAISVCVNMTSFVEYYTYSRNIELAQSWYNIKCIASKYWDKNAILEIASNNIRTIDQI